MNDIKSYNLTPSQGASLPAKVYLRRKEVLAVVGGWRQLAALEAAGHITRVVLPGYVRSHYTRAQVAAALSALYGPQAS